MTRDFKDAESARSGPSHVPSQPAFLPPYRDPGRLLSRNNQPPDIWNPQGISGNVFANPRASSSSFYPGGFNPWISNVTEDTLVLISTGRPVTCGDRQTPDTTLGPRFQIGPSAGNSFDPKKGRFSKTADLVTSLWQIPYTNNICFLEDKIQNWGMDLFTISYGSYAMDRRSGDGWIRGWSEIFAFYQRNSWSRLWVARRENCFSTEQNHPEYPLQKKKNQSGGTRKPKKRTVSFAEDRLLTWSTNTSGSLGPMILSRIMPIYLQLFFEMMIIKNPIQSGMEFYYEWRKSHLMTSWKSCTN